MEPISRALRLLRERRRLSQRQVAEALGVHPSVVSAWECGEGQPSLVRFGQLADLFDLDLGDLDEALEIAGGWPRPRRPRGPGIPGAPGRRR